MDEFFARLSKAGRVVCGRQHTDGGYYCDEPVAAIVRVYEPPRHPERRLLPLPGWRMDRKSIWRRTTSIDDLRAHGRPDTKRTAAAVMELPALACCPKCGTLQWLDAARPNVAPRPKLTSPAPSRWVSRPPAPRKNLVRPD